MRHQEAGTCFNEATKNIDHRRGRGMSKLKSKYAMIASSLLLAISAAPCAFAQTLKAVHGPVEPSMPIGILPPVPQPIPVLQNATSPLDSNLYTTYTTSSPYTYLNWVVCGSTRMTEGCYGSGNLGPFGMIGAAIEGDETTNYTTQTITQNLYVVDQATNGGSGLTLYIYQRTDVITNSYDTTTMTLTNTVPLPLTGGVGATTYMAANKNCLFIGTNKGTTALRIQKSNLAIATVGGFSPPINVSSITTNRYGYVTVTFGGGNTENGFYTFDSYGNPSEDGGGGDFMLNTTNGLSTGNGSIVSGAIEPNIAARMQVRIKQPTASQSNP